MCPVVSADGQASDARATRERQGHHPGLDAGEAGDRAGGQRARLACAAGDLRHAGPVGRRAGGTGPARDGPRHGRGGAQALLPPRAGRPARRPGQRHAQGLDRWPRGAHNRPPCRLRTRPRPRTSSSPWPPGWPRGRPRTATGPGSRNWRLGCDGGFPSTILFGTIACFGTCFSPFETAVPPSKAGGMAPGACGATISHRDADF